MKRLRWIAVAASLFLASCQAVVYGTATDFEKIHLGMTKAEVIAAIGRPVAVSADGDRGEETLVFKRMKHAVSAWPRTYAVTLRDGVVVKFGEQYEEHNTNVF